MPCGLPGGVFILKERLLIYKIRPNQSATLSSALQWIEKRKWQGW